jgi:hypothetical protein
VKERTVRGLTGREKYFPPENGQFEDVILLKTFFSSVNPINCARLIDLLIIVLRPAQKTVPCDGLFMVLEV